MPRSATVICLLMFLLSAILVSAIRISATEAMIVVTPNGSTIQDAINAAYPGSLVYVEAGTYRESVVINKSITLAGHSRYDTVIEGVPGYSAVVHITASKVTLKEFTIANQDGYEHPAYMVRLDGTYGTCDNNTVRDNIMVPTVHDAIEVRGSHNNTIRNNIVSGKQGGGPGIVLVVSYGNTIYNNTVTKMSEGIFLLQTALNVITSNRISNCNDGILLGETFNNTLEENQVSNSQRGLVLGFDAYDNVIRHNSFVNNTQQAPILEPNQTNVWNYGYPLGGNHWSDCGPDFYKGVGQNISGSDGIADTPYVLDADNVDHFPLEKPYPWDAHDIGVAGIKTVNWTRTLSGEGTPVWTLYFNVSVMNYGGSAEIFNVSTYANTTLLGSMTSIAVASKGSVLLTLVWNTSGFEAGYYTLIANITAVPSETDTNDNTRSMLIYAGIPGDVDRNGKVNMLDLYMIALHYGSTSGDPSYMLECDIDLNGIINMLDLYTAASSFGQ